VEVFFASVVEDGRRETQEEGRPAERLMLSPVNAQRRQRISISAVRGSFAVASILSIGLTLTGLCQLPDLEAPVAGS
jgi:hypothetical protein